MSTRIQKLMLSESRDVGELPPLLDEREEIPASTQPKINVVSVDASGHQTGPQKVSEARHAIAAETRKSTNTFFKKMLQQDMLASLGYVVYPMIAGLVGNRATPPFEEVLLAFGLPLIAIWVISSARLLVAFLLGLYRGSTYRKPRGVRRFDRTRRSVWLILFGWFVVVLHPVYGLVALCVAVATYGILLYDAQFISGLQFGAFFLAMAGHVFLIRKLYRKQDTSENRRLLILRVFNMDRSAFLTFDFLLSYWRHFGSSFTVIDPAYLRYQYRGVSSRNVAVTFWTLYGFQAFLPISWALFGASLLYYMDVDTFMFLTRVFDLVDRVPIMGFIVAVPFAIVAVITGYLIAFVIIYRRAPEQFAKSSEQIKERINTLMRHPRKFDRTFKDLHIYCFDNTWRIAVAEFVTTADVVLMDLRGFSDERKGCEYEVDFLFDSIAINRIVFVLDAAAGSKAIEEATDLIFQRWEHLRQGSPNLNLVDPEAKIYTVSSQTSADVQNLADHLMTASVAEGAVRRI